MVPLLVLSLCVWGLIIERLMLFRRLGRKEVIDIDSQQAADWQLPPAARCCLCHRVIRKFLRNRTGSAPLDNRILDRYVLQARSQIQRSLTVVAALATAAPLMGLFGTVTGMITTFEVITVFGTGNAKALAGGISEAMITTQSGLLVGIPGLFMTSLMRQRARHLEGRLEETVMALRAHAKLI